MKFVKGPQCRPQMSWRRGGATTSKPLPPPTDDDAGSATPLKWADLTLRSWPDHHNDAFGSGAASTAHHLPTMELSTASKIGLSLALGCFLVTVAYFAVGGTGPAGLIHGGTRPPNIVFYLSDDQGYNSVKEEVTPYLKGLQTAGVTLTKYYAQEACAPTRMALLTGRYPLSIGIPENELAASKQEGLPLDETTFPEVLQRAGYTTYMLGKWNLGNASPRYLPTARGFDYFLGFLNGYQFYWSKLLPDQTSFRDLAYADKVTCEHAASGPSHAGVPLIDLCPPPCRLDLGLFLHVRQGRRGIVLDAFLPRQGRRRRRLPRFRPFADVLVPGVPSRAQPVRGHRRRGGLPGRRPGQLPQCVRPGAH